MILVHVLMVRFVITARPRLHPSRYLSYTLESPKGAVSRFKTSALRLSGRHLIVYPSDNNIPRQPLSVHAPNAELYDTSLTKKQEPRVTMSGH